jgi:ribonuclease P protein component
VTRNLLRRRVRAIFHEHARAHAGAIPPGAYLVGGGPDAASLTYGELRHHVLSCVARIAPDAEAAS